MVKINARNLDGKAGAIAAVNFEGMLTTGGSEWRAVPALNIKGDDNSWQCNSYDIYPWPCVAVSHLRERRRSEEVQYDATSSNYIWTSTACEHDRSFLRTVVGGGC